MLPHHTPRIGVIGIMQELYDDMLPGITERQGRYLADVAAALEGVAETVVEPPARNRADVERVVRAHENAGVDGLLVVMLTYGPGQRVARALGQTRLPLCLANIQPEPNVTAEWDMADMTYNQGVHGAQDTANALVRAGATFDVDHRGLEERRVPRARRPLGARRRRGDRLAQPEGRPGRLRDGRHGRHPRRRGRAAALARPEHHGRSPRASSTARPSR